MVDAIDAWVDVIFFAVATASSATAPVELKFHLRHHVPGQLEDGGLFAALPTK